MSDASCSLSGAPDTKDRLNLAPLFDRFPASDHVSISVGALARNFDILPVFPSLYRGEVRDDALNSECGLNPSQPVGLPRQQPSRRTPIGTCQCNIDHVRS